MKKKTLEEIQGPEELVFVDWCRACPHGKTEMKLYKKGDKDTFSGNAKAQLIASGKATRPEKKEEKK